MNKLDRVPILKSSGYKSKLHCKHALKSSHYQIISDVSVGGDAPKSILRIYEFGNSKKASPKSWPIYIVKTGQKWYPSESITEFLLMRLGTAFGLNMAESKLCQINGQIRFLSKFFLNRDQQHLVHGAEIYAGQLSDDLALVEEVEAKGMARSFFTLQFTQTAIKKAFPNDHEEIFKQLVKMLLFDALVGNNDRHFYNWAVIQHIQNKHRPYFSPIYDTARGLFWNTSEEKILSLQPNSQQLGVFINKYYNNSRPKIGLENSTDLNHFDMAQFIIKNQFGILDNEISSSFSQENLEKALKLIDKEFKNLYSKERINFIQRCLSSRFTEIFKI